MAIFRRLIRGAASAVFGGKWILEKGIWDDAGVWDDDDVWKDSPENAVAYYQFDQYNADGTFLLEHTNKIDSLNYSVIPTVSDDGIVLVAATNASINTSSFTVNDFQITFTTSFESNPATAVIFENELVGAIDRYTISRESGGFKLARSRLGLTAADTVTTSATGDISSRTFDFVVTQSSTTGMTLTVDEVGGSVYSDSVNLNTSETVKNINPWQSTATLAERTGNLFSIDMTIKDLIFTDNS